jgi:hypothetical protein
MFTALLVLTVRRLGRVGRGRTTTTGSDPPSADTTLANAMRTAGIGLLIGGFFLHVWIDLHTSLTFWGCAGLALGVAELPVSPRWQPVVDARE